MSNNAQDSAMIICYRECLSNLEKFNGGEEQKILQFINNIERIDRMIHANGDILHCMCTAKLDGKAKRWYEDNMTLTQWENLKSALLDRFTTSDSSSNIVEQLKERKQKSDETITSYYDAVIKLCREYDSSMSQKMMISGLQNGIKDSLKTQIKRQMKLLPESARTTQAFLKIAKDELEFQEEDSFEKEPVQPYLPLITNTISTTSQQTRNDSEKASTSTYSSTHEHNNKYTLSSNIPTSNSTSRNPTSRPRQIIPGTHDGGHSSNKQQNPSAMNYTLSKLSTPIYINVQVNNKQHRAIVDTGSAVTIINQQLLKKIYHKEFIHKKKLHKSANCSSINIIDEIQLEIKIQGYKTFILADVATNLITDLSLGNDWIMTNNVIIDTPQRCIFLTDQKRHILATAQFVKPSHLQSSVLLADEITLPPRSEKCIDIKVLSSMTNISEALFEPAPY
ncbi:unnamed protein product [Rotaria sordida]|uniref:Retrotransposon gag domain-containing protein n=1 Tax=Rotaria sordida TaxID=392033 RepID=A0A819FG71_9BILA|nr:unnamed protein product [Rotaria sordida]CAF1276649.1 unnamed protein product [Rotaria sordida]CAF3868007.1 unnamed protein product [Rotaria sordida]CAF4017469.1 unnamed protein product [Rotaria sordida]